MLRKLEYALLGGAMILLPFAFEISATDQFRVAKIKALCFFMSAILASRLWQVSINLAVFYGSTVLSLLFISPQFYWFFYGGTTAVMCSCLFIGREPDSVARFLKYLQVSGVICATCGYLQMLGYDVVSYYEWADLHRPIVFFGQHTLYGPFAVAAFLAAFSRRSWFALYLFPVFFGIDASFTYFAASVGLAVFVRHWFGWRSLLGLTIIGIVAMYTLKDKEIMNDKGRFALWGQTIQLIERRPWLGYGYGSFKQIYPTFQDDKFALEQGVDPRNYGPKTKIFSDKAKVIKVMGGGVFYAAHNEPLQFVFEFGRLGIFILMLFATSLLRVLMFYKTSDETAGLLAIIFSFIANGLGSFPFHLVPQVLVPLWAYVLLLCATGDSVRIKAWLISILTYGFNLMRLPELWQKISVPQVRNLSNALRNL